MYVPEAYINSFFEEALEESRQNTVSTRAAKKLQKYTERGQVRLFHVMSPPGSGSTILTRMLYEAGAFDGVIMEPAGQFNCLYSGLSNDFAATLDPYIDEIWSLKAQRGILSNIWKKHAPFNILVMEKPQHLAPGAEMEFISERTERTLILIRDPLSCIRKRLRISTELMAEYMMVHSHNLDDFIAPGFIEPHPALISHVKQDDRDMPVATKIKDYMIGRDDYSALTPKAWVLVKDRYLDQKMHNDTRLMDTAQAHTYSTDRWNWAAERTGMKDEAFKDLLSHAWIRRITGWSPVEEYFDILAKGPTEKFAVLDYPDFCNDPDSTVKTILQKWDVPERNCPVPARSIYTPYGRIGIENDRPTGFLNVAFGKAMSGQKIIQENPPIHPEQIPVFLKPIIVQDRRAYERLKQGSFMLTPTA